MPELPDIAAYIKGLETRVIGQPLMQVRSASPFLLRTVKPSLRDAQGRTVRELRRIGKRIAIGVEGDLWLVLHLMIAGRLHWRQPAAKLAGRRNLAAFDFPGGTLVCYPKRDRSGAPRCTSFRVRMGCVPSIPAESRFLRAI